MSEYDHLSCFNISPRPMGLFHQKANRIPRRERRTKIWTPRVTVLSEGRVVGNGGFMYVVSFNLVNE